MTNADQPKPETASSASSVTLSPSHLVTLSSLAPAIHLRGVRVHNLKGVDVDLPLGRLSVICGVSGAGKSSLAFDTLYAEAQRRYLQSFSPYTRQFLERLEQPEADEIGSLPPAIAVLRSVPRGPRATVGTMTEVVDYLRLLFARLGTTVCIKCGQEVRSQQAGDVLAYVDQLPAGTSFSVGFPFEIPSKEGKDREDWVRNLREEGYLRVRIGPSVYRLDQQEEPEPAADQVVWVLVDRLEAGKFSPQRLADSLETAFARGQGRLGILLDNSEKIFDQRLACPRCHIPYPTPEPQLLSFNDPLGACPVCSGTGTDPRAKGKTCSACRGTRLNDQALAVRLAGRNLAEVCAMRLTDLGTFIGTLDKLTEGNPAGLLLLEQIQKRLKYLDELALGYLSLDHRADRLSTGEAQRVRLTAVLGSNLVNALYVLEEPTAGLAPSEAAKVLEVLHRLRDSGNTIVLVEHNLQAIRSADYLVELGPGAGEEGGQVVYQGPPAGLEDCPDSLTGDYLAGRRFISAPSRPRPFTHGSIRLLWPDRMVEFPLGVLCVVAGREAPPIRLVQHLLYPALCRRKNKKLPPGTEVPEVEIRGADKIGAVVLMEQAPFQRTARSNPATYLKVFDDIRRLFAETSEARIRNLGAGAFSFNQPGGRCETCQGQGSLTVDMQFLADVTMTCPECQGARFQPVVLAVKVRNLSIAEVLNLTVREAFRFFRAQPAIEKRLKPLLDVGLDYLRLGQPADTLSGGECQRLKLAGHLASSRKPHCLFLLIEPATGLHLANIATLLDCFDRLLEAGHSLIVVENHSEVVKCADQVVEW